GGASGLVLTNDGKDDLAIATAGGAFTFTTKLASGSTYDVAVKTQPGGGTGACVVSGGSGTVGGGNVTSVVVNCAPGTFTVGGTIAGLNGTVVLQDNGASDLVITSNGTFAFATTLAPAASYAVTILTQPAYPPRSQT